MILSLVKIPPLGNELELIRLYGSQTVAITLNTSGLTPEQADEYQAKYQRDYGVLVVQPLKDGVSEIIRAVTA